MSTENKPEPIDQQKASLRKEAKDTLHEIFQDQEKIQKRTKLAIQKIKALKEFRKARVIAVHYPMSHEIDLSELLEEKFKVWALPKALGNGIMSFFEVQDFESLMPGRYGVMEPPATNRLIKKDGLDLIIAPALAFDKSKYRLGRGGGYYDKLLDKCSDKTKSIGICFKELLKDELPREEHDAPVDILIEL